MPYFEKLPGKRVYLSPPSSEGAELFAQWISDSGTAVNMTFLSRVISVEGEREFLQNIMCKSGKDFAIVARDGNRLIGSCGLVDEDQIHSTAEIGIFIGDPDFRGQGYGTEALNLLLDFCFRARNLHSVQLKVYAFNKRAIACYKKCGFKEAGCMRETVQIANRRSDILLMDKLASEHNSDYLNEYFDD